MRPLRTCASRILVSGLALVATGCAGAPTYPDMLARQRVALPKVSNGETYGILRLRCMATKMNAARISPERELKVVVDVIPPVTKAGGDVVMPDSLHEAVGHAIRQFGSGFVHYGTQSLLGVPYQGGVRGPTENTHVQGVLTAVIDPDLVIGGSLAGSTQTVRQQKGELFIGAGSKVKVSSYTLTLSARSVGAKGRSLAPVKRTVELYDLEGGMSAFVVLPSSNTYARGDVTFVTKTDSYYALSALAEETTADLLTDIARMQFGLGFQDCPSPDAPEHTKRPINNFATRFDPERGPGRDLSYRAGEQGQFCFSIEKPHFDGELWLVVEKFGKGAGEPIGREAFPITKGYQGVCIERSFANSLTQRLEATAYEGKTVVGNLVVPRNLFGDGTGK